MQSPPHRLAVRILHGALLVTLATACGQPEPPASFPTSVGRVPVVLVVFDALDAEHISHLGYERPTTPHLDALAREGVSFRGAFSPAPYTLAGIASLVTGRLPDNHGMIAKTNRLRDEEVTLAEMLGAAGYRSLAVVGNPNGGESFGDLQGFDEIVNTYEVSAERPANYTPVGTEDRVHISEPEEAAAALVPFLDGLEDPDAPFFFYAHVLQPHSPYTAPEELRGRWLDPSYDGPFLGGDNKTLIASTHGKVEVSPADAEAVRALYDANLVWADQGLQLILDELKSRGLYEKCLILVTSDHGEALFQHGLWGHNSTLFDEMLEVPLVVRFPGEATDGTPRGQILEGPVSIVDVLPSLAEWLDMAAPGELDGQSLAPYVAGQADAAERIRTRTLRVRDHSVPPAVGLRTATTKVILRREPVPAGSAERSELLEFYDLVEDPGELRDLAPEGDPRAAEGYQAIKAEIARILANYRPSAMSDYSEEEEAMMGALGYTDDAPAPEKEPTPHD